MTTTMTLARLRDLRLSGMAQALVRQQEQVGTYEALPFLERLGLLVEQECLEREHRKQERLIRQARFKLRATVQDIDYQHPRNVKQEQIQGKFVLSQNPPPLRISCHFQVVKHPSHIHDEVTHGLSNPL